MELRCAVQQYAWGKLGRHSEVALLNSSGDPDFMVDDNMPYAELWMGTHPNGPSVLKGTSQKLSDWIKLNSDSLGKAAVEKFGKDLPFLFKVLSVNQALSIQAHPDKKLAEQLHKDSPDVYKDPNHKPELAIALTRFETLCGFRPIEEIKHFLEVVPELRAVVGKHAVNELLMSDEAGMQHALKNCFHSLLTCPAKKIDAQLQALLSRLASLDESSVADECTLLLQILYQEYPGDVGCFCIYFLNHLTLQPGQALYMAPNEPHAYLKGDCVECMACSDNVVRAGLTPKPKDVSTLCNMLTYICEPASNKLFQATREDDYTFVYRPPLPDFAVAKITVPHSVDNYSLTPRDSASILLVVKGCAITPQDVTLGRGSVLFLPAQQTMKLRIATDDDLLIFQAMCNTSSL